MYCTSTGYQYICEIGVWSCPCVTAHPFVVRTLHNYIFLKSSRSGLSSAASDSSSSDSEGEDTLSGSERDSSETDPSGDDECFERALVADSARWAELEEVETRDPDVATWYYMFG
eukprot:COSAG02_NODE_12477_length_1539_cov_6.889583_1_plen_115_part_00